MRRGESRSEQAIYEDLVAFHALVRGAGLDSLATLVSERLARSTWDIRCETALALLREWATAPADADDSDTVLPRPTPEVVLPLLPPLSSWLSYLGRFPEGSNMAAYRRERADQVRRWYPHLHPTEAILHDFLQVRASSSETVRTAVRAHVLGPYHCLSCRRALERIKPPGEPFAWARSHALAAATPEETDATFCTRVLGRSYALQLAIDEGYLRACLLPEDEFSEPVRVGVTIFCFSGKTLTGVFSSPEQSCGGFNLGKLPVGGLAGIVGFDLEVLSEEVA